MNKLSLARANGSKQASLKPNNFILETVSNQLHSIKIREDNSKTKYAYKLH